MKNTLLEKFENRTAVIGVLGLGYVGLPLMIEFSKGGFPVIGFDIDTKKIEMLKKGESYIRHITAEAIAAVYDGKHQADATVEKDALLPSDLMELPVG